MPTQVQVRGAITATQSARTLATRELDVNTTLKRINVHDGSTTGGIPHANYVDVQNNRFCYQSAVGTNALTLAIDPAPTAYASGQSFKFKAQNTNTASVTLNIAGLGAKTVKKPNNQTGAFDNLDGGDIIQNGIYTAHYNGTDFVLEGIGGSSGMTLVEQIEVTTPVAEVEFLSVFATGFMYVLYMENVTTGAFSVGFQYSNDGGSTYHSELGDYSLVNMVGTMAGSRSFSFNTDTVTAGRLEFYNLRNTQKIKSHILANDKLGFLDLDDASFRQADSIRIAGFAGASSATPTDTIDSGKFSLYRIGL